MKLNQQYIRPLEPAPNASRRLLCLSYGGGSGRDFARWMTFAPSDLEMLVAELPGRGRRIAEAPIDSLAYAAHVVRSDLVELSRKPLSIFGHCSGAALGFALANIFEVERLFVAGQVSPCAWPDTIAVPSDVEEIRRMLDAMGGTAAPLLQSDEFVALVGRALSADARMVRDLDMELEPIRAPITLIRGTRDSTVSSADMEAWKSWTTVSTNLITFDGDHFLRRSWIDVGRAVVADVTNTDQ